MMDLSLELDRILSVPPIETNTEYDPFAVPQTCKEEQEKFSIDSVEKANWAIRKLKEAKQRRDLYNEAAKDEIERIKFNMERWNEKCDQESLPLLSALDQFLDTVPAKKGKTQISLELPAGKIVRKLPTQEYVRDELALVLWLQENAPDKVKTEAKAKWSELKKELEIQNGQVVWVTTGEVLTCVKVEERPGTVEVK